MKNIASVFVLRPIVVVGTFLLLALTTRVTQAQTEAHGIFVTTRYRNWTSASESEPCQASSCEARIEEGCLPQVSLQIENVCYKDTGSGITVSFGSTRRVSVGDGEGYCNLYCADNEIVVDQEPEDGDCTVENASPVGKCMDDDPSATDIEYLPNFCIESSTPKGDFTTALYENRLYANETNCEAGDSSVYLNQYLVGDDELCLPTLAVVGDTRILGSATRHCESDGTTTATRYTDPSCTEQSSDSLLPDEWIIDGCTGPDTLPDVSEDQRALRYTADCTTPKFYCKDFSTIEFMGKNPNPSNSANLHKCAGGLVSFVSAMLLVALI